MTVRVNRTVKGMVEIIEKPPRKLVVGERIFYTTSDDLGSIVALAASAGQPVALFWAEGILFIPAPAFPDSEVMVEKYLEGETYWASVAYTRLDRFQEKIRVVGIEIPIVDVSRSKAMREAAVWLKEHIEK